MRVANQCHLSTTTVHRTIISTRHEASKPQIVQLLHSHDYVFADPMLEKIRHFLNLIKLLMLSDEANFHLNAGINSQNFDTGPKLILIGQS